MQSSDLSPHYMQRIREPAIDDKSEKSVQQIEAKYLELICQAMTHMSALVFVVTNDVSVAYF